MCRLYEQSCQLWLPHWQSNIPVSHGVFKNRVDGAKVSLSIIPKYQIQIAFCSETVAKEIPFSTYYWISEDVKENLTNSLSHCRLCNRQRVCGNEILLRGTGEGCCLGNKISICLRTECNIHRFTNMPGTRYLSLFESKYQAYESALLDWIYAGLQMRPVGKEPCRYSCSVCDPDSHSNV